MANLLLSFYLRLSLPIGINFSMWDFFFTWDRKFLTFYLNLSIFINYYTFLVITVYIFFFYAIYEVDWMESFFQLKYSFIKTGDICLLKLKKMQFKIKIVHGSTNGNVSACH